MSRGRVLILWNQLDDDVVELWRRDGRRAPDWDPNLLVEPWDTVAEEIEQIVDCVKQAGYDAKSVNIRDNFETLLETVRDERPDVVMNLIEWFHDDLENETYVPAMFELLNQPYTGNRPLALALCQKKPQAKALLAANGLPVPRGIVVDKGGRAPAELALKYPLIVKPAFDDASGGIDAGSVVRDRAALDGRVMLVTGDHKMPALVEEFIEGREIHCAVLGGEPLPLYEMAFKPGGTDNEGRALPNIITYRAKWDPYSKDYYAMESKCPAPLDPDLAARMQAIAVRAYQVLGCRDYARVDMRLDTQTNEPYILEVNPNPDLADGCAFAQCVRASGRTYAQAVQEIVGFALERARTKTKNEPFPSEQLVIEYKAQRGRSTR